MLGVPSYAIMVMLMEQETAFVFRQSANTKTDFRKGQRLGAKDHIICYKKPKRKPVWMSKEDYEKLPGEVLIREFAVNGTVYVTSLMDTKKYPKKTLAELYSKRWNIELDFRTIKTHMGMEMLRCKTAEMIDREIAVNLLAYNLTCGNIAQSAYANDKEPRHISFMATVQLMRRIVGLCMTMVNIQLTRSTNFRFSKIFYALFIHSPWQERGDVFRGCSAIFCTGLQISGKPSMGIQFPHL